MIRDLAILFVHLLVTISRLFAPGGARSVVAESLFVKHQLLILNRSRTRAPDLRPTDRVIVGLCAIFMRPARLLSSAIVLKPSTILSVQRPLIKRKYRLLFILNIVDHALRATQSFLALRIPGSIAQFRLAGRMSARLGMFFSESCR